MADVDSAPGETPEIASSGSEAVAPISATPQDYTRCPRCDARRFVARQLVYEQRQYDEQGDLTSADVTVRAALEYCCADCGTRLREMPVSQPDFYGEVAVLRADLDAAVQRRLACWVARLREYHPGRG
ncbi:hypothetical protein ACFPYI_08590 [Halomarina salina]|uniref:Uncharacterized protein n=1 Tax=Halomarina salina TaxID=1872699 RepID=A0ABD5RM02_9EURY|nr:hypothetical protein [Halomarina salina]